MNDSKRKNNQKNSFLIIILMLFFIVALLGVAYSLFRYSKNGIQNNTISTSSINFSFNETTNGISLKNTIPMRDEVGKKLDKNNGESGYFDFNVSYNTSSASRTVSYEIYVTPSDSNTLDGKYVKIYLTDENDQPIFEKSIKTFDELDRALTVNDESKQLYYGSLTKTDIKKFRLRMWISEDYPIENAPETFKLKVNVNAFEG